MKKIIFILLISLLFSCRSTREITKTETVVKTETETETIAATEVKTETATTASVAVTVTETGNTITEETIVELSKPDSTGRQHAEKVITRKTTSGKTKQTGVIGQHNEGKSEVASSVVKEDSSAKTEEQTSMKTKRVVKQLIPWKVIAILTVIVGFAFLIIKFRYKIFKFLG